VPRVASLARTPRLVDEVVDRLRTAIVDGSLTAGTRLPQVSLAEQMGVSRTPMREALRVLEVEGLVRTLDNRSVEVVQVGVEDLQEMYQLREVIDGLAARLAASRGMTARQQDRAAFLLEEMAQSSQPYDPVRRNAAHAEFHELIALASGNTKVQSFASLIRTSSAMLYLPLTRESARENLAAESPERSFDQVLDAAQVQHREIVEAILARDPEAAEAAARRHIRRTLRLAPHFG
jgi:GntR family transcriptional regulator, vanillate catabolism transcriptional regulator